MKKSYKINEIREFGLDALSKTLGPDGMIRFIQQFDSGSGDYSKDRHKFLDQYNVENIVKELKSK